MLTEATAMNQRSFIVQLLKAQDYAAKLMGMSATVGHAIDRFTVSRRFVPFFGVGCGVFFAVQFLTCDYRLNAW